MKLEAREELTHGVGSIQLQQKNHFVSKKNQRVQIISSHTKGLALWEIESAADYEVSLPLVPAAHIVLHRESGGCIRERVDDCEKSYTVKTNSISIIPALTPAYVCCSGSFSTVHLTLPPNFIRRALRSIDVPIKARLQLNACSNSEDSIAANLMAAMVEYARTERWQALASMATALTVHLIERYGSVAGCSVSNALDERQIEIAEKFMMRHLGETPDINRIAKILQLGIAGFSQKFKTATGFTPLEYYRKLRMQRAKELIETSEKTLTEIAMDLGFTDAAHFSKTFHKHWSFPPSTFRTQKLAKLSDNK